MGMKAHEKRARRHHPTAYQGPVIAAPPEAPREVPREAPDDPRNAHHYADACEAFDAAREAAAAPGSHRFPPDAPSLGSGGGIAFVVPPPATDGACAACEAHNAPENEGAALASCLATLARVLPMLAATVDLLVVSLPKAERAAFDREAWQDFPSVTFPKALQAPEQVNEGSALPTPDGNCRTD